LDLLLGWEKIVQKNIWSLNKPRIIAVTITVVLSALFLNWMGYVTIFGYDPTHNVMTLGVSDLSIPPHTANFGIGWQCAGVQSLFIYTCTVLLLLKKMDISLVHKIVYFVIGAIGTFLVNVLRIVSIYLIFMYQGEEAMQAFHNFYGELYSIAWIVSYLMIIILNRMLSLKLSLLKSKLQKLSF